MKHIERNSYLKRLIELRGTPDIKIITGVRRCGKSELLKDYIVYCQKHDADCNIIVIDFMDLAYEELKEYHNLYKYICDRYSENKNNYIFIDEVQLCPNFELAINSLHSKHQYDIYVTGSNAFLLSADLATLFTGRYVELHVFPFDFTEYCDYHSDIKDIDLLFDDYVEKGGLAGSYVYRTNFDQYAYIREVYNTIMHRDLLQKYNFSDNQVIDMLAEFLLDNTGNLTSVNKIAGTLTSNKFTTNHVTIGKYLKYLTNAFLFYKFNRYDIKGKKYLESSNKYYAVDTGLRYSILGTRNMDYGRIYENIVALELLRRGYEVYIGKLYEKEIDFVAKRGSELFYIQVSDNIDNEATFNREVDPLFRIRDSYPKLIIARTKHDVYKYEGIGIYDIARWLISD